MFIKILLLLMIYAAIWIADISKLKKLGSREIIVYSTLLLLSLYLGISTIFRLKWPFLEEAAAVLIGKPARHIIEFLKVSS